MKKLSKKGVLLFAAAMALCALAMPSMAGATSWTVVGSEHTLDSPNVGFESTTALGTVTSQCTQSSFTTTVSSLTDMRITGATFGGDCTAHGPVIGTCISTARATALPWTATAIATNNVQIHGIDIDVVFDQTPGGTCSALAVGANLRITGTLTGATWTENTRTLDLNNAPGLTSHSALGSSAVFARGTFNDTQNTLTMHD